MMESGLRLNTIEVNNFGSISEFKGVFSDRVFVDNSYENSDKIGDLMLVIKVFLNMGLRMPCDDDSMQDIIIKFRDKMQKHTYIEIGFTYDRHAFLYRACMDDDGIMREYVRDVGSKFTIQGKLLFAFMSYIMNPYLMMLSHVNYNAVSFFNRDICIGDFDADRIWYAIKHYEPVDEVNGIIDFTKADYDEIARRAMLKYGYGIVLLDKFSVRLTDDGIICYINGEEVDVTDCDRRYLVAYLLIERVIAGYLTGMLLGIEDANRVYPPMVLDANLEDNNYLDFTDIRSLVKDHIFALPRQIFLVDGNFINRLFDEDTSLTSVTHIFDTALGLTCINKSLS